MNSNKNDFNFLKKDMDTENLYEPVINAEKLYLDSIFGSQFVQIRVIVEEVAKMVVDFANVSMSERASFDEYLKKIKYGRLAPEQMINNFYELKKKGNDAAHDITTSFTDNEAVDGLHKMYDILVWFMKNNMDHVDFNAVDFVKPERINSAQKIETSIATMERKLIYVQTADNSSGMWPAYDGLEKIGDATTGADDLESDFSPNSEFLRDVADKRVNQYMTTSGVPHKIEWAELAFRKNDKSWFRDHDVHEVLRRSGVSTSNTLKGNEWYEVDLEKVKQAISAVKEGRESIQGSISEKKNIIVLRPEQKSAVEKTRAFFKGKKGNAKMLWNAKMRFGKTLTALELIKQEEFEKVLIMTHRPVVSDSWFEDFGKMHMSEKGYSYGSRDKGDSLVTLNDKGNPFVYFASIQDLRGSSRVGGQVGEKNELVFDTNWDLVITDEAHEGTQTELATNVLREVVGSSTKELNLSGTPFNIVGDFDDDAIFTWDYTMEQQAKLNWSIEHPDEKNPYESLPKVTMYTFDMNRKQEFSSDGKSFNFKEFFRVDETGKFVYENDVEKFLTEISRPNKKNNYPYSTKEFREELRHTLWLVPGVNEAKALKTLMENHPVFGADYKIINVVDKNDNIDDSSSDLQRVRSAITDQPSETKTITITVRKLTTGVNIKEWTGVMFLSNTNSAMQYLQAAFRAQTPFSDEKLGQKQNAYIFDFAPDRALTVMAESANLNTGAGKRITQSTKQEMSKLLNFLPIIGQSDNGMKQYAVDAMLTQVKRVYAEKAVQSGFDDDALYSDDLLMTLDDTTIQQFNNLKKIVGTTNKFKPLKVEINTNGLTEEEYEKGQIGKKKPKKNRTKEEQDALDKIKKLNERKRELVSILRSISIRIPMMIYGMNIDIEEEINIETFIKKVDNQSWEEFMPKGVTKGLFKEFVKYYDPEIFIEAGRIIRNRVKGLDNLTPIERAEELSILFGTFKNPDKETVLTPWKVINSHLGNTIGGLNYFDDKFESSFENGVPINRWIDTAETEKIFRENSSILEINSKTGLYPLYAATSLFYQARDKMNELNAGKFTVNDEVIIWRKILEKNIFVIAKTPMSKTISERTLMGYRDDLKVNVKFIDNIIEKVSKNTNEILNELESTWKNMKFDVIIGNPPYQESDNDSGNGSAKPIYQHFMKLAKELKPKYISLITPSVWFTGGKGLDSYRNEMLNDSSIKEIYNFETPKEVFPTANLRGGVSYFLWDQEYDNSKNGVYVETIKNGEVIVQGNRPLKIAGLDILISNNISFEVVSKLISNGDIDLNRDDKKMLMTYVSVRNPFGFSTTFVKTEEFHTDENELTQPVKIYASGSRVGFVEKNIVLRNVEWIDRIKVLTPFANNIGTDLSDDNLNARVVETNTIATETFLVIGAELGLTSITAANLVKYLKTKFVRFLISLAKANQNGTRSTYMLVPLQNFEEQSDINWSDEISNIDAQLFKKYGLTELEIKHINDSIQDMEFKF